jgi:hypothetical protein
VLRPHGLRDQVEDVAPQIEGWDQLRRVAVVGERMGRVDDVTDQPELLELTRLVQQERIIRVCSTSWANRSSSVLTANRLSNSGSPNVG